MEPPLTEVTSSVPPQHGRSSSAKTSSRTAKLLMASLGAVATVGMAAPAQAAPGDPYVYLTEATDDTFVGALNRIGLGELNSPPPAQVAKEACSYIRDGHSIRDAVQGVQNTYGGLPVLQSAHFMAVARAIYCPDTSDY